MNEIDVCSSRPNDGGRKENKQIGNVCRMANKKKQTSVADQFCQKNKSTYNFDYTKKSLFEFSTVIYKISTHAGKIVSFCAYLILHTNLYKCYD